MEGRIGVTEILFLVVIALLLFGPGKFAALTKSFGEGIRNFKAAVKTPEETKQETKEDNQEAKKS